MASNTVTVTFAGDASDLVRAVATSNSAMDMFDDKSATSALHVAASFGIIAAAAASGALVTGVALAGVPLLFGAIGIAAVAGNAAVKSAFTDMKDHVVTQLQQLAAPFEPVLIGIAAKAKTAFDQIAPALGDMFKTAAPMVDKVVTALLSLVTGAMPGLQTALNAAQPVIDAISKGFANMGPAIGGLFSNMSSGAGGAAGAIGTLFSAVNWLLPALGSVLGFLSNWSSVIVPLAAVIGVMAIAVWAVNAAMAAYEAIMVLMPVLTAAWTAAQWLLNIALDANPIGIVVLAIAALVAAIVLLWQHSDGFRNFIIGAWGVIKSAVMASVDAIVAAWNWLWQAGKNTVDWLVGAWHWLVDTFNSVKDQVVGAFNALRDGVVNIVTGVIGFIVGVPGRILGALGNVGSLLYNAGADIISGLWNGISSMVSGLYDKIKGALSGLVNAAKSALGISSPSTIFADEVGKWIPEGLALGITANLAPVQKATGAMASAATGSAPKIGQLQAGTSASSGGGVSISFSGNVDGAFATAFMNLVRAGSIQIQRA